ncbi:putative RNA-directed DNA polymerase from transposon X-element [Trichonephila clavipes]|nr:putative RNA-directed DNA polymerase from transposon X-element [Trichonephila clavipes]
MSTFKITCTTIIQTKTNIPTAVTTSSSAHTQLLPSISSKTSTISNPQPPTPMSETKGEIKEQPSPLHRPRKDNKKIDLMSVKTTTILKKKPAKNTSVKIAREQDSPNESTSVSKRSRRRKTSKTLDAMDTDVDSSDTDYVTDDVKDIIRQYHPVCVALQETFLKFCHTTKIRRYGCVRKDTEGPSVSGGICIFTSLHVPSSALPLHTSLQAVAVRIHSTSLITVCCLYLPPNTVIHQHDLKNLVDQLPAPFVILGDFNGHSTLWGNAKPNPRGRQIEQVLSDHCLCLLNHEEPTYFHEPPRSFHTLDLAICSPSLFLNLNLSVEKDLYNSDNFPVILSHDSDAGGKTFPPTYSYSRADWDLFTQLAGIPDAMVKTESVDTAVQEVTNVLIAAASIPKVSSHSFQRYKPWWNTDCQTAYKNQRRLWGILRRYPTTENLLAFKKAKANARRVRRRSRRQSWIRYVTSLTSSTSSKQLWKKKEHCFPSSWREAIVIPILKPGKVATDPLSYRPIALTSCFCKTFERMVNTRLVYVLEKEKCISPLQSGFRKGRSPLDNLVFLESQIRDAFVSCQGSDMRLIERQLQTTVNRLVKWCDQNGHTISPSKSSCVHFCRKRNLHPDPSIDIENIQIPVVSKSLVTRVYQALILSRLDYGCVVYGSARASVLKRLDAIHHSALRICSGAFRTSPVTSLYVVCHQPPLELRRKQLSANYFIRAMSVPSHPLKPFALAIGLNRLYEARSFNIKPFLERAKAVLNYVHLNNINIQENNILAFPPWDIQIFNYSNPFSGYDKAGTAAIIYQQLFSFHRSKYSKYIPVYTDGSKTVGHVGCGVVFNDTILSFSLHNSMSVFSAELTTILVALQHILISNHRHFCVYTDSISALESLHFLTA